ncbi:calpain-8-like [Dendropsophus ebraccatus]|uniref:calpain-8-like n=1 Tax=Dendropsophus ebraccatus TaxID=150705 RepID=UPI0038315530
MSFIQNACPCSYISPKLGTLENPRKFRNQDYDMLRKRHLKRGDLFSDESFTANKKSIGWRQRTDFHLDAVIWKRPKDVCDNPQFIVDGTSPLDILQNQLGDCWFLCSIATVTTKPEVLDNIVPRDQGFNENYAGIFRFRFWQLGEWFEVVVDDQLPFLDDGGNCNFLSAIPPNGNEFWPCLLEKAYAKLVGSYESLDGGYSADAFRNLTGALSISSDLKDQGAPNWDMICWASRNSVMACNTNDEANESKNLISDHAYSITSYATVPFRDEYVRLIQVRNPWGQTEWTGDWSDSSPLWNELIQEDRERLQKVQEDGQFWIRWEDFITEFSNITICSQVPDFLDGGNDPNRWQRLMFPGRWTKDNITWTITFEELLMKNPSYEITVTGSEAKGRLNVVISLIQNIRNRHKFGDWLPIGFMLYKLEDYLNKATDQWMSSVFRSKPCVNEKYSLEPGKYCIIPATSQGHHKSTFLLQAFVKSLP